jgi:hypothetical protein
MKKLLLTILCTPLLLLHSCKKENKTPKELDFHYLITRDVSWDFHFKGQFVYNGASVEYDTSYHRYVTAQPSGDTQVVDGNTYYSYLIKADNYQAGSYLRSDSGFVLLREDIADKMIYMRMYYPNSMLGSDYEGVDYRTYSGEIYFDYSRPSLTSYVDGTILIDGVATQKSSVDIPGNGKGFYKAVGIGGPFGPFGPYSSIDGDGGSIVSMDFHYKGTTLHFDY